MKHFRERVAAITGAGSGIGRQLALALAKQHCHLSLSDINEQGLNETAQLVQQASPDVRVTTAVVNVADRQQVEQWASQTVADHGAVHLVVNNAGVALGSSIEGSSYEDLQWIMDINFWGVVHGTKAFLPYLKQSGDGHIVNISSLFGLIAQPTQAAYNASKFAVRGFTESLRQELKLQRCGVSATCVHPGGIRTNIANAARVNDSLRTLGIDPAKSTQSFNRLLRTPAEDAAQEIIKAVQQDAARLLIGGDARLMDRMQRLMPTGYQTLSQFATKWSKHL